MEHHEAVQLRATERYLLGELSGEIREQFESHLFGCRECAQEVQAGAAFIDAARDILLHESPRAAAQPAARGPRPSWIGFLLRPALLVPTMAMLLVVPVYQNTITIPRMKASLSEATSPRVLTSFSLISEDSRGGAPIAIQVPRNRVFSLFVDIPPEQRFPSYTCEFETESGTPEFSIHLSASQAASTLQFLIPPSRMTPGKNILVIRGDKSAQGPVTEGPEVARYQFSLDLVN